MTGAPLTDDLTGPVLVVGAGLLGTSVGLALRARGVEVFLTDVNEENVRTASGLGAGSAAKHPAELQLVVVAVPPDHLGPAIAAALTDTRAVVTDVGSVKGAPLAEVRSAVPDAALARYVGSHPMAGSERSGPLAASSVLFDGRPWAVAPHAGSSEEAVAVVTALVEACGATPFRFSPEEHDEAVARTSHLPHVVAALVAGALAGAPPEHLVLSGQGVRDVTRIAAGDPRLWEQILTANATALTGLLREVRSDLDGLLEALEDGSRHDLGDILGRGVAGTAAIPGKHGGPAVAETGVFVAVPDHPGELARLFSDVGDIGVNVEDVRIDHDPGRPVGLVELTVATDRAEHLQHALAGRGWSVHR
ncbi:MAG: Arogenate dehydrogenase [uncultured Nocardioidaceae bacterium]|uniref:Prephenate dehydrogenase n=1 Tax=uncultured Nocardioidaceae bacterium TaxID=253824 RepID=A0A6J4NVU9_9ACTN|nr:MAG: Arogenate dehydrogenase [uncultured Nocardioidaceae bacterium]